MTLVSNIPTATPSPDTEAVLAGMRNINWGSPATMAVAQAFRALVYLDPAKPLTPERLLSIAEELYPLRSKHTTPAADPPE
jgi:hypothetical protein